MKNIKVKVSTFLLGIILGVSTMSVLAAVAYGEWGYYGPFLGYEYQNQAYVGVLSSGVWAGTTVSRNRNESGNVPIGYMGCQARLFKDNALYSSSTMTYNDEPLWSFTKITDSTTKTGTYYSKGITAAYNGNGYSNYYTFASPSQNY